jgi:hypothetical protein
LDDLVKKLKGVAERWRLFSAEQMAIGKWQLAMSNGENVQKRVCFAFAPGNSQFAISCVSRLSAV